MEQQAMAAYLQQHQQQQQLHQQQQQHHDIRRIDELSHDQSHASTAAGMTASHVPPIVGMANLSLGLLCPVLQDGCWWTIIAPSPGSHCCHGSPCSETSNHWSRTFQTFDYEALNLSTQNLLSQMTKKIDDFCSFCTDFELHKGDAFKVQWDISRECVQCENQYWHSLSTACVGLAY